MRKLEESKTRIEQLAEMRPADAGALVRNHHYGAALVAAAARVPRLDVECEVAPVTHTILKMDVCVRVRVRAAGAGKVRNRRSASMVYSCLCACDAE